MNRIKISVITVAFNSERYIEQTILSVISQTYSNIEYIVIDGCSSDNTVNIINKYSDKISYFLSEPDKNMYDAINKGMKVATGDFIAILNSDDYYIDCNLIQKVVERIEKLHDKNIGGVYGNLIKIDKDGNKIRKRRVFQVSFKELLLSRQLTMVGHATVFLKSQCIKSIGFYDFENFNAAADYDYILRRFLKYKIKYFNLDIFNFRSHPFSITSSGRINGEIEDILKKNGYYKYSPLIRRITYYYVWSKFILLNSIYLLNRL